MVLLLRNKLLGEKWKTYFGADAGVDILQDASSGGNVDPAGGIIHAWQNSQTATERLQHSALQIWSLAGGGQTVAVPSQCKCAQSPSNRKIQCHQSHPSSDRSAHSHRHTS